MPIEEQALRRWMRAVADGKAKSRRQFMRTMLHLGLTGPLVAQLLATQTAFGAVTGVQARSSGWRSTANAAIPRSPIPS